MESLRNLLPENLWRTMIKKLGREEALRLLWTTVVGSKLASQTALQRLRGTTMVVSVPDAQWTRSLQPLEKMIVDAVNRFPDSWRVSTIEFVVQPPPVTMEFSGEAGRAATRAEWDRFKPDRVRAIHPQDAGVALGREYTAGRGESEK
jgi:Dna[CI] antecedent, DciA